MTQTTIETRTLPVNIDRLFELLDALDESIQDARSARKNAYMLRAVNRLSDQVYRFRYMLQKTRAGHGVLPFPDDRVVDKVRDACFSEFCEHGEQYSFDPDFADPF